MPTIANKKIQGPSLYKLFVDAYMKAHPNEKHAVSFFFNKMINIPHLFFI